MKSSIRITQQEKRQAGAATLLMATVLLMAVSMIGVYSTRSGVVETRVAANAIWSQQATDTAQRALDSILAVKQEKLQTLATGATSFRLSNDSADKLAKSGDGIITVPAKTTYTAEITSTDSFATADVTVTITNPGGTAKEVIFQRGQFGPYLKALPQSCLVALDSIDNPTTKCQFKPSATVPPLCPRKAAMMAKKVNGNTGASLTTDPKVSQLVVSGGFGMTPAQWEASYFSDSGAHLREAATLYLDCTASACTEANIPKKQAGLIWVDGTLTLGKKAEIGDFGTNPDGTGSKPALLVVSGKRSHDGTWINGNLKITDATVNGLIYTRGNWDNGTGKGTVNGAVIINGTGNGTTNDASGNATGVFTNTNLDVNYEPWVLTNVMKLGSYARVAGSWRDF